MTQPTVDPVLTVLHQRVSFDLAQVASRSLLTPSEAQVILDGYVRSGRVRVEGGRYLLAPTSRLADRFAAMCDHAETEPHECDSLLAAHDAARMIRELSNPIPRRKPVIDDTCCGPGEACASATCAGSQIEAPLDNSPCTEPGCEWPIGTAHLCPSQAPEPIEGASAPIHRLIAGFSAAFPEARYHADWLRAAASVLDSEAEPHDAEPTLLPAVATGDADV